MHKCKASTFRSPIAVFKGIPQALCTVDIGGAVAYIGEVVTFINLIVLHCQDRHSEVVSTCLTCFSPGEFTVWLVKGSFQEKRKWFSECLSVFA